MNMPNKTTSPLLTFFNNLTVTGQADFKKFVADELGKKSRTTLRNWMNGNAEPTLSEKKAIAKFFTVNQETIFPNK